MMNSGIGVLPPRGRGQLRAPPDPPEIQVESLQQGCITPDVLGNLTERRNLHALTLGVRVEDEVTTCTYQHHELLPQLGDWQTLRDSSV